MPSSCFICCFELVILHYICQCSEIDVHLSLYLLPAVCVILEYIHLDIPLVMVLNFPLMCLKVIVEKAERSDIPSIDKKK